MRAKLFLILRNRVLSRVVFVILFLHVLFTTNDFTVLLLLLLLNYLLTLEDSDEKKTEKSKLGRNLNSRLIGPLSLFIQGLLF